MRHQKRSSGVGIKWLFLLPMILFFSLLNFQPHGGAEHKQDDLEPTPGWAVYFPSVIEYPVKENPLSRPSWGSPIAISHSDGTLWVVNPDSGSVTLVATPSLEKVAEISIGEEPRSLAIAPDGRRVYVVDRAAGTLAIVDAPSQSVEGTIPIGAEPGAVALNPTGSKAYVTLTADNEVVVIDTAGLEALARIPVEPGPYGIVITDDGDEANDDERVYVTHLFALPRPNGAEGEVDGREGMITVIDTGTNTVIDEISLGPNTHGFPNLLAGITISGSRAWVPHLRSSPELPNDLTSVVFATVSSLDLESGTEDIPAHLPLNDQEIFGSPVNNPAAAVPSPDGETLYVILAGSDLVEVIDVADPTDPRLVKFLPTGSNPRGMALSRDGRWGYVMNYLSRSVTALDLEQLVWFAEMPVTHETLDPEVLHGKILFHHAADPRMSLGSWISCASCHPDGGSDSVTWMFPDGPRQTPPLWNAGKTLPWHWSAALDEPQDVEETIQSIQHGLGLAPGTDPPLLGSPNAGRSTALDALAAFLMNGIRPPAAPKPEIDLKEGRQIFTSASCASCHGGPTWTSSALPGAPGTLDPDGDGMVNEALHDVGTVNPLDVRGETGFDPPSLFGVGLTPPYLHDGSAPTLEALLTSGHPDPYWEGNGLTGEEISALAVFLRSIGPGTVPIGTK